MISTCCGGAVYVAGRTTNYYVCVLCLRACDALPEEESGP